MRKKEFGKSLRGPIYKPHGVCVRLGQQGACSPRKRNEQIYESAAALVSGSTYLFGDERLAQGR